jgi:hypothetical protein
MSFSEFLRKVKEFFLSLLGIEAKPEVTVDEVVEPEVEEPEVDVEPKVYTPMHPWYPLPHIKFRR